MKFISITTVLSTLILSVSFAKKNSETYYNVNKILEETHWKEVEVDKDAPFHLSVISQGYYDKTLNGQYDKNFYYPASTGEGVDVYMFDYGFDFTNKEFEDIDARIDLFVSEGNVTIPENDKVLYAFNSIPEHGTLTSSVVAGKYSGIARKANIHGVFFNTGEKSENIKVALEYFKNNIKFKPHKTVLNFAEGYYCPFEDSKNNTSEVQNNTREIQKIINELTDNGVIVVSVAGNNGMQVYDYVRNNDAENNDVEGKLVSVPCALQNVICVGGVTNFDIPGLVNDEIDSSFYTLGKYRSSFQEVTSNYGEGVDIYAPFAIHYRGKMMADYSIIKVLDIDLTDLDYEKVEGVKDGVLIKNMDEVLPGTSFASPNVVGVIASLISENPETKFNHDNMLAMLTEMGEKNIIQGFPEDCPNGCPNVFINNGKKIVYDANPMAEVEEPTDSDEEQEITDSGNIIEEDIDSDVEFNQE